MAEGDSSEDPKAPEEGAEPALLGPRRRRLLFFALSGALLLGILLLFRGVLLPFLLAIVLAYVFAPVVSAMSRAMPRWIAVVTLYLGILGALSAFVAFGIPRLAVELEQLGREAPALVRTVQSEWLPMLERELRSAMASYEMEDAPPETSLAAGPMGTGRDAGVPELGFDAGVPTAASTAILITPRSAGGYQVHLPPEGIHVEPSGEGGGGFRIVTDPPAPKPPKDLTTTITDALKRQVQASEGTATTFIAAVQSVVKAVIRGVFGFFIMLMISAYLLVSTDRIFGFMRAMVQVERQDRFDQLLSRIDRGLSGVVRGQLLIAVVNGVLSGIGFYLFDLKYWPVLTIIATVLSIIPIFGAILSTIPAVIIALQQGVVTALLVLGWIIAIHQLEANVLNPKIMGDAAKVHPVLVVFALLAGEHLFGIVGALLAVPVLSISQSLFMHYREVALGVPAPRHSGPPRAPPVADTG